MLTDEQVRFYRENGFLLVKGLLSRAEAAELRAEAHGIAERLQSAGHDIDATWGSAKEAVAVETKTELLHCHDVQFHSALFGKLVMHDGLTEAASQVMGTPNVQLHHTKMFIKPPEKGSPFPMHQDHPYFPHEKDSMIAVIVHLDDAPEEKGCLRVYPGSHKRGALPHDPEGGWHLPVDKYPLETATVLPAEAGDALFFSYLTIHGSGLNESDEARTTVLIQMRDPMDPPTELTHLSKGQGWMLRGINPSGRATLDS